jgi:hypothetical protein
MRILATTAFIGWGSATRSDATVRRNKATLLARDVRHRFSLKSVPQRLSGADLVPHYRIIVDDLRGDVDLETAVNPKDLSPWEWGFR